MLSLGLVCAVGLALLTWYYGMTLKRPARAAESARAQDASRAGAETSLPPLPALASIADGSKAAIPRPLPWVPIAESPRAPGHRPATPRGTSAIPSRRRRALDRRLSGPAFSAHSGARGSSVEAASEGHPSSASALLSSPDPSVAAPPAVAAAPASSVDPAGADAAPGRLAELLTPTVAPAVAARVLPTRTLLLPKGAFIDCTLETAIDSSLPGMTTCITATDTFGADGKVVLLERGSKLIGETRGEVRQGSTRVFVLWTEARTPTGVVIPLASPGTDELGRSGLPGAVNRHFFERFGAALLISIIDAGAQAAAQSRSGAIIYSPTASQGVMSEVLRETLRIPPTVVKHQGDRIQVLVARDIDFRSVYELRTATGGR